MKKKGAARKTKKTARKPVKKATKKKATPAAPRKKTAAKPKTSVKTKRTVKKTAKKAKPVARKKPAARPAAAKAPRRVAPIPPPTAPGKQPAPAPPTPAERPIGAVTHYYSDLGVAVVQLNEGTLRVGEMIHIKGHTTDLKQPVESIEIEHQPVQEVLAGQTFGLKVRDHTREHDHVYKISSP